MSAAGSASSARRRLPVVIYVLAAGTFLMGTTEFVVAGLLPEIAADFRSAFGRDSGGLLKTYRLDDAETVVVALGSVLGTIEDVVDSMRDAGVPVGVLGITCFRPWPGAEVRAALAHARRVVVVEKPVGETEAEEEKRRRKEAGEVEGRVWITYHEGFSNAVRKPLTLAELMKEM